jgi:hypothetical protein
MYDMYDVYVCMYVCIYVCVYYVLCMYLSMYISMYASGTNIKGQAWGKGGVRLKKNKTLTERALIAVCVSTLARDALGGERRREVKLTCWCWIFTWNLMGE